jgi:hypothetical protein
MSGSKTLQTMAKIGCVAGAFLLAMAVGLGSARQAIAACGGGGGGGGGSIRPPEVGSPPVGNAGQAAHGLGKDQWWSKPHKSSAPQQQPPWPANGPQQ